MLNHLRKGQSTAEYAIVIGLVIAAALAMQTYVKRGLQGHVKDAVEYNDPDAIGQYGVGSGLPQFEPQYETTESMTSTRDVIEIQEAMEGGGVKRTTEQEDVTREAGGKQIILAP